MGRIYKYTGASTSKKQPTRKTYRKPYSGLTKVVNTIVNKDKEFKYIDTTISGNVPTEGNGVLTLLNGCTKGDDVSNREGRQINMKSIQINGFLQTDRYNVLSRHMIIYDKQPDCATPAITSILTGDDIVAFRNLDNRKRFVILWDKTFTMTNPNPIADSNDVLKPFKWYKKINLKTQYDASDDGDIDDITTGALFYYAVCQANVSQDVQDVRIRLRYTD